MAKHLPLQAAGCRRSIALVRARILVASMLLSAATAEAVDRGGNIFDEDGESASFPPWARGSLGVGLLLYAFRKPNAPDRKLAVTLGLILLLGLTL